MDLPEPILTLAAKDPAGLFCRKQVFKAGFTDWHIDHWRRTGLIVKDVPGWYRVAAAPLHPLHSLYLPMAYMELKHGAAKPRLSGDALPSILDPDQWPVPEKPLVLIQRGTQVRVRNAPWEVRQADLRGEKILRLAKLRFATEARCLADMAATGMSVERLLAAADAVRNKLRVTTVELMEEWERMRHHPGARRMLKLTVDGLLDTESGGERRALEALFATNPPAPDCQVQVTPRRRADFAFVFSALILEYYGEAAHSGRVDADGMRQREVRAPGWDYYVITKSMLACADEVAGEIHELRRERELGMLEGRLRRPPLPPQPRRRTPLRTLVPLG